jgi:hypothetical protein
MSERLGLDLFLVHFTLVSRYGFLTVDVIERRRRRFTAADNDENATRRSRSRRTVIIDR